MQQELTLAIRVTLATLARPSQATLVIRVTPAILVRLKQATLAIRVTLALRRSKVSALFLPQKAAGNLPAAIRQQWSVSLTIV